MNGVALALLAFLTLILQSALAPRVAILGARPDWLLVLTVFLGLYAKPQQAVLAAMGIGVCADLLTIERFGLLALSYGLSAAAVAAVRDGLFRYRATTHFGTTLGAGLLLQTCWLLYRRAVHGSHAGLATDFLAGVAFPSVYTSLWAVPVCAGLLKLARWIGVRRAPVRLGEPVAGGPGPA